MSTPLSRAMDQMAEADRLLEENAALRAQIEVMKEQYGGYFDRAEQAEAKLAAVVEAADIELAFGDKSSRAQLHAALAAARGDSTEQGGPDA